MKSLIGLVLLVIFSFNCFGQQQPMVNQNDTSMVRLRCCGGSLSNSKVLLIVNNQPYSIKFLNSLNPNIIKDINIFKSGDAVKKYGSKANEGVIVISTTKKVRLISALSILKRSKIDQQYFKLALSFKGKFLDTPYIFTERHKKYQAVL
ncbi:MAG: hypothetical protein EOO20_20210, partial [Chryseobacterium sp.]